MRIGLSENKSVTTFCKKHSGIQDVFVLNDDETGRFIGFRCKKCVLKEEIIYEK